MSTGEDEPSSGLNGRLRPRKSVLSPQTSKTLRKTYSKPAQDKPKKTATPSKVSPKKPDDLTDKSDSPTPQILCLYCDKIFVLKQAFSNHIRRFHLLTTKQDYVINCLFCPQTETDGDEIIRHMIDNHPNQYFACYDCHTRFSSTKELAEHKINVCQNQKIPYRNKLRQKKNRFENDDKNSSGHGFNGIVISCELKPSRHNDPIDIEDNITTNLIVPTSKNLGSANIIEKNAIIVLDDLQWKKRLPSSFSFHNTDADQILSRLGVVHRSPRAGDNNKKDWLKHCDDSNQKFEKCFDTRFYSKVASNVLENLTKFLDGSFYLNRDPENTIKTRKSKNSVAINTVEGFPILLAAEQFSRNVIDGYTPRAVGSKYKWKWDNMENDKNMTPEQFKFDPHTNNCIVTLVSSLDIWTQLCMRRKFQEKISKSTEERRNEKQSVFEKELKEILESRELPSSSSQVFKYDDASVQARDNSEFPASLGLIPNAPNFSVKPAVLSGEWVRPRCYVCSACGTQTSDSKALSSHISTQHPMAEIQSYEIVGDVLLNSDILKHLYVPPSQLNNRTRPLRGFRECTKCRKSITLEDLHQHMLDCAGDTPTVRRKCRYRPFGVRKRRPRLPDNTLRKEMRQDIRHSRHNRKTHMRPRPKIRTEVGDAETIRKMIADLPAKRHRVIANPLNPNLRPRRILRQRNKLVTKKRVEDNKKKSHSSDTTKNRNHYNDGNPIKFSPRSQKSKVLQDTNPIKQVDCNSLNPKILINKKSDVNKNRRKAKHPEKNVRSSDVPRHPVQTLSNIQTDQMSIQHNSDRMNINGGSFNTRENADRNDNSDQQRPDNRDNQGPGSSRQNDNPRDSFAPSQHVPLKHSIASLTASSEPHDKSFHYHHLYLSQQECNNTTQHLPSRQIEYFENEAIVTKLDKPPLHFEYQRPLDPQFCQRIKLNKPRKALKDCIKMLKNKLVEPHPGELPDHVSVQCGSDEPIDPEPVIERRHSTADSKIESAQRSLQMFYPNKTVEDIHQSYDMGSVVTGRPATRYGYNSCGDNIMNVQPNNHYLYWNQYSYEQQVYATSNSVYPCNRREGVRRRSVISTDELLVQHAMNYDMLANNNANNFTNYHFPYGSTSYNSPRKSRQGGSKARKTTTGKITKSKNKQTSRTRHTKSSDFNISPQNCPYKLSEANLCSEKRVHDIPVEHFMTNKNDTSPSEKNGHHYIHPVRIEDKYDRDLNMEKSRYLLHKEPLTCQNKHIPLYSINQDRVQNKPMTQYTNNFDRVQNNPVLQYPNNSDSVQMVPMPLYQNDSDRVQNKPMPQYPNGRDRVQNKPMTQYPNNFDRVQNNPVLQYPNNGDSVQMAPMPLYQNDSDRVQNKPMPQYPNDSDRVQNKPMTQYPNNFDRVQNNPVLQYPNDGDSVQMAPMPLYQNDSDRVQNKPMPQYPNGRDRVQNKPMTQYPNNFDRVQNNPVLQYPNNGDSVQMAPMPLYQNDSDRLQNKPMPQYSYERDRVQNRPMPQYSYEPDRVQNRPIPQYSNDQGSVVNESMLQYSNDHKSVPVDYNLQLNDSSKSPLDLSKISTNVESSQNNLSKEPYAVHNYVPLQLSNGLSGDCGSQLPPPMYTQPEQIDRNNIEDQPYDLSYGTSKFYHEPDQPSDLRVREKDISVDSCEKANPTVIQNVCHPMKHAQNICVICPNENEVCDEQSHNVSNEITESILNISPALISESLKQPNVGMINLDQNRCSHDDGFETDSTGRRERICSKYYLDENRMSQFRSTDTMESNTNDAAPIIGNRDQRLTRSSIDSDQMTNAAYTNSSRISCEPVNVLDSRNVTFSEQALNDLQNRSSTNLMSESSETFDLPISANCPTVNLNGSCTDETYVMTEIPVSLSSGINRETEIKKTLLRESEYGDNEYEKTTQSYSLRQFEELDTLRTSPVYTLARQAVRPVYQLDDPYMHISNNIQRRLSCDKEVSEINMSKKQNSDLIYKTDTGKSNRDDIENIYQQTTLDHDPETARKIAMLPKELVEILGNMPIDHRNQLLEVLPQYVSTSSSSVLLTDNTGCVRDSTSSKPSKSILVSSQTHSEIKKGFKSEDGRHLISSASSQFSQIMDATPVSITSSILMTPPTPQLSERYSNQSHENEEYRKSQDIVDEQTSLINTSSDNVPIESQLSSSFITNQENDHDRVIDLTCDDLQPEITENTLLLPNPTNDLSNIIANSKSALTKTNSDKTASLRAVRIKTSSERQRTIIAENTLMKKHIQDAKDEHKMKTPELTSPKAIQQAEISSTQYRSVIGTSSKLQLQTEPCLDNAVSKNNIQQPTERQIVSKSDQVSNYNVYDKQNIVTSTITKDANCNLNANDTGHLLNNDSSVILMPVTSTKKADTELCLQPKKAGDLLKNKIDARNKSLELPCAKPALEDDDSEDDVTLAVIFQQKHQSSHSDQMIPEINLNTSKFWQNSELIVSDKESLEEKKKEKLSSIKTTSTIIVNSNESSSGKYINTTRNTNEDNSESQIKESSASFMKKSRMSRRVPIAGYIKDMVQQSHSFNNNEINTEKEINKKSILSSETTKNTQSIDDTMLPKTCESETNQSSYIIVAPKNKVKLPNDTIDCHSVCDVKSATEKERANENAGNDFANNSTENLQIKKPTTSSTSPTNSNTKNHRDAITEDFNNESSEKTQVSNMPNNEVNGELTDLKNDYDANMKSNSYDGNKEEITEIDELITTPVRRSRRGISLFNDSNSTIYDKTVKNDNSVQHKGPLTKKHLIFSKLLLDEENHNKPLLNSALHKQESFSNIQFQQEDYLGNQEDGNVVSKVQFIDEKNGQSNGGQVNIVAIESCQEQTMKNEEKMKTTSEKNINKRKKSPQSKRKSKKKKSLMDIQTNNEEVDPSKEEKETASKICILNQNLESHESSSNTMTATRTNEPLDLENKSLTFINVTADEESFEIINDIKTSLIEKRKSIDSIDMQSISKAKKSKSNDEKHIALSRVPYKNDDNGWMDPGKSKAISTEPTSSRNTTCYDKATRRARSKSVVVKSAEVELYDPYDIDLEDMVDKTEPYIRKEISSKISFNTFISTIGKTRKSVSADVEMSSDAILSAGEKGSEKLSTDATNLAAKNSGASDSDESTKSDVPLKTYAEEKERKIAMLMDDQMENKDDINNKETCVKLKEKSKTCKKNKQIESDYHNETTVDKKIQNEEELRSEQFMESFGFFSERKPRKSNLLATKKISETFNLIENDDAYYESKDRENKKCTDDNINGEDIKTKSSSVSAKKTTKKGGGRKEMVETKQSLCEVCKRFFRRWDNYLRHQLYLYRISRLCEIELKIKTVLIAEEPNYLLAYRQQLIRLKMLQNKIVNQEKDCLSTADIVLPTFEQILADVKKTIREQQLSRQSLSREETIFTDCCEMLKAFYNGISTSELLHRFRFCNSFNCARACQEQLILLQKSMKEEILCEIKNESEMDSLTAKAIMESDEVRNLLNDLISNLKHANGIKGNSVNSHFMLTNYDFAEESTTNKCKKQIETKEKMYPDVVDTIDMFEDKFDKIKRKCRSQAAAAKQVQTNIQTNTSKNDAKKSDKKNVRKKLKKTQNSVPTKAALKGFEEIKVSIQTTETNMAAIVPVRERSHKNKKKSGSKKKRDRKLSEKSINSEKSDLCMDTQSQKKVDVYEFLDTEDTEVFEFRPSTLMERLKSINNKELPGTSKSLQENDVAEISSESGSDGDDFVYMSDDYVGSDGETENSILSFELGNGKGLNDLKKISSPKRKDTTEKNAVMGKIFKHNAVRSERKSSKVKEFAKPKANLDQLFDSLLKEGPNTSLATKEIISSPEELEIPPPSRVYLSLSPQKDDFKFSRYDNKTGKRLDHTLSGSSETGLSQKYSTPSPTLHPSLSSFSSRRVSITPPGKSQLSSVSSLDTKKIYEQDKKHNEVKEYDKTKEQFVKKKESSISNNHLYHSRRPDNIQQQSIYHSSYEKPKPREKSHKDKIDNKKRESIGSYDITDDKDRIVYEDAGVARQRTRRKCTVGKQNVLAETWSSESEPDGLPPRPNSAESVIGCSGRKKRGKKKDGLSGSNRKANRSVSSKKQEYESSAGSSNKVTSGVPARPRLSNYWSDGDDEQEHPQQHGWIVGNSHKKLVTMLAHAKGRKRSGDDKGHLIE